VKYSKAQIFSHVHKIPELRFEDQQLASFAGTVIIQKLLSNLNLKARLRECFDHLPISPIYGNQIIALILIVPLMLGYRRLRDMDYYSDDLTILRLLGRGTFCIFS